MKNSVIAVLMISAALVSARIASAASGADTRYQITIRDDSPAVMIVEATFILKDDLIAMNRYGADQFPERWAKFVSDLSVTDIKGRKIGVEAQPDAKWRIDAARGTRVRLRYQVTLDHEKHKWASGIDGVSFVREWGIFCTGRTYLITNGESNADIAVKFKLPPKWHITTPWKAQKRSISSFIANGTGDLMGSMIFAGTHEEFTIERDGFELVFALGGNDIVEGREQYKKMANGVMDYYIDVMGGVPNPPPTNKFARSVIIINPGKETDGEVIGNNICIILDPTGDAFSQIVAKFIFAHEFFHLWNGKSIQPADTTEEWFKEGFTNYYALKALSRIGEVSENEVFGILNGLFYQKYTSDPGYSVSSMRDVAAGDEKHRHWGLIYGGGLFTSICQDVEIRTATKNAKDLDILMRDYFKRYGGSDRRYSSDDLQNSFSELSGRDRSEYFRRFVFGPEPVPIADCLNKAGLDAKIEDGQLRIARKTSATDAENAVIAGVLGK